MSKYIIQDRETGTPIEETRTMSAAIEILEGYEEADKANGVYTEDYYEIVEANND